MRTLRYNCSKQDCTIAATGKCVELNQPSECPNATASTGAANHETPSALGPASARTFPPVNELGINDARVVTLGRYVHLIAVLGATDAGKTCMLNSLYLLASHAGLAPRFRFAGSLTLAGFELRARRLRKWTNGRLPESLTEHTSHSDERNPGLLHLALSDEKLGGSRVELLLTDLPGEWTTKLVEKARTADRFMFLQRADGLVIAVDGLKLHDSSQKHIELRNLEHLIDRLANAVDMDRRIPIFFVACRVDAIGIEIPPGLQDIVELARGNGFVAQAAVVVSFSANPDQVPNGYGIQSLVESIIDCSSSIPSRRSLGTGPSRSFGRSLKTE